MFNPYYLLKEKDEKIEKVELDSVKRNFVQIFLKRFIDILFSSIALITLLPVFVIVAVCIFVDSPGSVIFSQYRIGKDGKPFKMYKFRSMVLNAESLLSSLQEKNEASGPMFKIKDDPRITKVGKFIRKTSIDELPQLWNVLKGEMSLVGPRPALPSEVNQYTKYQKYRLIVKPGCSGLWQVCGRSQVGFDTMIYLDLIYIREQSIFLDFIIILETIKQMFCSKTAY
ncbi:sugar transferase [Enterococcus faecalis]|uniref:sugar transferase n=1 Tax=Enterococcus faecalis TaxID=1351 RepID=UPI000330344F|nr:exopolysaccharide biosynthesis polyprenyl glycosylphosphotransferase [Enterococcus faecalis]EHA3993763.1 sugar transferase [Enterococcus faecalis]EHQ8829092.1 exopolysaccharide biosynthesis polyprenyl glycosylphosphotransferase [Enterococcus faecalis]EOJ96030.1 exopolysaccharide biosynthesis polyprenyl glycosylphosphotransferase [Enterococcus faecalis EnGen0340]MBM9831833.1 exopolysaccharide biosynthesis polyprenyl glycosylphosphotransferase [Enterococcus faecalis]MCO5440285.1 exopolysaccha